MKKGLLLLLFLLFYSLTISSQVNRNGTPLISCFDAADTPGDLRNLCITMDGRGVMYFGNEAGGILTYDGTSWSIIHTPGTGRITALVTDTRGIVFAGGENNFGLLRPDDTGRLAWHPLAVTKGNATDSIGPGPFLSIAADSNEVCFTDGRRLYTLYVSGDTVSVIDMETSHGICEATAMTAFDGRIFIADSRKGLFARADGSIIPVPGGEKASNTRIVKMIPYGRDNLILASADKGLMLFNIRTGVLTGNFGDRRTEAALRNGVISDVAILPGNFIAVGLEEGGGVYILENDGSLLQHISEHTTSVREASVSSMFCDHATNSQLWFCTRGYINRAYVSLPATEFGRSTGVPALTGPVIQFADSVFIGAADGLYKNHADRSGVMRFRRIGSYGTRVNDLITSDTDNGTVLLCATDNGLLQIDGDGDATWFLRRLSLKKIRNENDNPDILVAASDDGTVMTISYDGYEWLPTNKLKGVFDGRITGLEQTAPGEWWFSTEAPSSLIRMHCESNDTTFIRYGRENGIMCDTINGISFIDERLYVGTGRGIYMYNRQDDAFLKDSELAGETFNDVAINILFRTPEGETILSGYDTRNFDALVTTTRQGHVVFRRQFDYLPDIATTGIAWIDGSVWLAKGGSLFILDKSKLNFGYGDFRTIFTKISSGNSIVLMEGTFFNETSDGARIASAVQPAGRHGRLRHINNDITFTWSTTSYVEEDKTEYRYRLEGFDEDWSPWDDRTSRDYTNLPAGDYSFIIRARTITGLEGEELRYAFTVWKPWYASFLAKLLYAAFAAVLLFYLVRYFARRLRIRNQRLQNLLNQRNEAKARGKDEIAGLERYAGIIQQALQPEATRLRMALPNSFVLNRPKGKVSGDFFWMMDRGERTLLAVGDCTGQGVPSALRTVMAMAFLDEIGNRSNGMNTSAILKEFRSKLSATFRTLPESEVQMEGIDISVLSIDRAVKRVEYSGAASQCFRIREMTDQELARWNNGEFKPNEGTLVSGKHLLETVYGDRIPLGMYLDGDHEFTQHTWKLEKESSYYLFTDGYADQFNVLTGKKFLKKNLRRLILDITNYPMFRQEEILSERLGSWMGKAPQTDDIMVVGLRIE